MTTMVPRIRHLPQATSKPRAADGGTVLVSSHILAEVAQTVDHVVIIDHGRLVRQGSLAEVAGSSDLETTFFNLTDENPR